MPSQTFLPGPTPNTVRTPSGQTLPVPNGWELLREKALAEYVEDFRGAVLAFLGFHERHASLANALGTAVTSQATPVGSGTVARTKRRSEELLGAYRRGDAMCPGCPLTKAFENIFSSARRA